MNINSTPHSYNGVPATAPHSPNNNDVQNASRLNGDTSNYSGIYSSSLCGMFQTRQFSKSDACALACCGVWLWERNRYTVDGTIPKSWRERPSAIALVVSVLAVGFLYSQFSPTSPQLALGLGLAIVGLTLVILLQFQSERSELRLRLAKLAYYQAHPNESPDQIPEHENRNLQYFLYQHQQEISRAHTLCSCYKPDLVGPDETPSTQSGIPRVADYENEVNDFCTRLWKFVTASCCGAICACWCVCCGMCAIAQEHRHLEATLPSSAAVVEAEHGATGGDVSRTVWEHDYITFQKWSEYIPQLRFIRDSNDTSFIAHYHAMSVLSKRLVSAVGILLLAVLALAVLPFIKLSFWQFPVLMGALFQPVLILIFVYWWWNRFDISLDAVVKYFASGFVICTGMAMMYEMAVSGVTAVVLILTAILSFIFLVTEDGDDNEKFVEDFLGFAIAQALLTAFLNAFVVAALVEELAKYLCFWMLEHPDMDDDRQKVSKGATITIAMVSVALGFACAENLLYVFIYTPPGISVEVTTLVVRSLLPVHPLAAALQSIGVCRRELEGDSSTQMGRILLPAWLLHGTYDFVLMAMAALAPIRDPEDFTDDFNGDNPIDADPAEDFSDGVLPLSIGAAIVLAALCYYVKEARAQRERLAAIR